MRSASRVCFLVAAIVLCSTAGRALARWIKPGFDHLKHQNLFPSCQSCHLGAVSGGYAMWPTAESCVACHDGAVEARVDWAPPTESSPPNLRFAHGVHQGSLAGASSSDSTIGCATCHSVKGSQRMDVRHAVVEQCLSCHRPDRPHLAQPDSACATCHVTLANATRLTVERVAAFPVPEGHREPLFVLEGHGRLAGSATGGEAVPASCATCHARDFCTECHVDALEQRSIQALAMDPRSLVHPALLVAPPGHRSDNFIYDHGSLAGNGARECRTCHTQESCTMCHLSAPREVSALPRWEPGRGKGAQIARSRPASHVADFRDQHASLATTAPRSCTSCHTRSECLDCHRPTAASVGGYHPSGFLTRHPTAAYARETSCADCHSATAFCAACHQQSGLVAQRTLRPGFHDAKQFFSAGHGQAARQSLETCVGCHTERDCLTCHSAQGGRRFNPHGPGFDAARLKRKNPEMCTACHGATIP